MTINYSEQIKQMMKQSQWEITTTNSCFLKETERKEQMRYENQSLVMI